MTDIKIDPSALQGIVTKTILDHLTDENREEILRSAIENVITAPPKSPYGGANLPSPLQEAFNNAVIDVTRQVAREVVQSGQFAATVRAKVTQVMANFVAQDSTVNDAVGSAIGRVMTQALDGASGRVEL